ncbi:MAG: hypothetical protein MPW15_26335 [Candidatus Manganitrophus sp.]|nr:hypothetical protein [Candidatus Manganitrophus sp.]
MTRTIIKKYNAEIHSQSAIEGILELKQEDPFSPADVQRIEIEIFDVAHKIIGGGEEGDKTIVLNKEQADHSLQYMVAAALLDDQVMPEQYLPDRIERKDVQTLLHKITVRPRKDFSDRFPDEMPCRLIVFYETAGPSSKKSETMKDSTPARCSGRLSPGNSSSSASRYADPSLRRDIGEAIFRIETLRSAGPHAAFGPGSVLDRF